VKKVDQWLKRNELIATDLDVAETDQSLETGADLFLANIGLLAQGDKLGDFATENGVLIQKNTVQKSHGHAGFGPDFGHRVRKSNRLFVNCDLDPAGHVPPPI